MASLAVLAKPYDAEENINYRITANIYDSKQYVLYKLQIQQRMQNLTTQQHPWCFPRISVWAYKTDNTVIERYKTDNNNHSTLSIPQPQR